MPGASNNEQIVKLTNDFKTGSQSEFEAYTLFYTNTTVNRKLLATNILSLHDHLKQSEHKQYLLEYLRALQQFDNQLANNPSKANLNELAEKFDQLQAISLDDKYFELKMAAIISAMLLFLAVLIPALMIYTMPTLLGLTAFVIGLYIVAICWPTSGNTSQPANSSDDKDLVILAEESINQVRAESFKYKDSVLTFFSDQILTDNKQSASGNLLALNF